MQNLREKSSASKARSNATADLSKVSTLLEQRKLPVFVFPEKLSFLVDDQGTHKQVLTIYNPYDFRLSFKILCTALDTYSVGEGGKGVIKPHCSTDIVIRRTNLDLKFVGVVDKFRVEISHYERTTRRQASHTLIGHKDISAALLHNSLDVSETANRKTCFSAPSSKESQSKKLDKRAGDPVKGNVLLIIVAAICFLALSAHTIGQEDVDSFIPVYFALYANQKLVAAYILGTDRLNDVHRFDNDGDLSEVISDDFV